MVARALLVVGLFAVVSRTAWAVPAPFFWYEEYDDTSSAEDDYIKRVYVFLNVTDFRPGVPGTLTSGTEPIPLNIPINIPTGQTGNDAAPLNIPIRVIFTVGNNGTPQDQTAGGTSNQRVGGLQK